MYYRRAAIEGGTYFFTVNLAERKQRYLLEYVDKLRSSFRRVKEKHPFHIDAVVILPNDLHAIWLLGDLRNCSLRKVV